MIFWAKKTMEQEMKELKTHAYILMVESHGYKSVYSCINARIQLYRR